uniref:FRIGIDA interacting protein 1 n=1 Tax=Kalanchoe fedtschenkoi TaxID=63787 RepID=A0A7N0TSG4_KALFE
MHQAGYAVLAVASPWLFRPIIHLLPSILCSCNALLLLLTGIFQQYLVHQVKQIRLQGYYSFSQKLKHIVHLPFTATAYGTAAMLLVMVWKPNIGFLSIETLLRVIILIQAICAESFMSVYIVYVHRYNSLDSQPDVLKSLYSPLQPSSSLEGLRYHDGISDQLMALLQYQRENLHFLSEEVDLAHLLSTRDQELRTLAAETNQLHSELKLARSLIAERDAEIQQVHSTNCRYVEENERLRAILGEWSARAAKLERALEMERMSNSESPKKITSSKTEPRLSP